jgi:hypothetical protein
MLYDDVAFLAGAFGVDIVFPQNKFFQNNGNYSANSETPQIVDSLLPLLMERDCCASR